MSHTATYNIANTSAFTTYMATQEHEHTIKHF